MPRRGFHSTMESPDWVSRVTPPITPMAKIMAAQTNSQMAIRRSAPSFAGRPPAGADDANPRLLFSSAAPLHRPVPSARRQAPEVRGERRTARRNYRCFQDGAQDVAWARREAAGGTYQSRRRGLENRVLTIYIIFLWFIEFHITNIDKLRIHIIILL